MPTGVYKRTKPVSVETRRKISESKKGKAIHPNTIQGINRFMNSEEGKVLSINNIRKAILSNTGQKYSEERVAMISRRQREYWKNPELRRRQAQNQINEKGPNWQGGKTNLNRKLRHSIEFRLWRETVFARDNWTCQQCMKRGGTIHPHHQKSFADYPEFRFASDNGVTLCVFCHQLIHKQLKRMEVSNG